MQMYRIKFARKVSDGVVDLGDVVVCANSHETAIIMVASTLDLPVADTQFEAARVKPGFYQISRRSVDNRISTFDAGTVDEKLASRATFPGVTESLAERDWFSVSVIADIHASEEREAICMLSRAIAREMSGEQQKKSVRGLDIACDRASLRPRTARVEQNALYVERRIFQGGDTRT